MGDTANKIEKLSRRIEAMRELNSTSKEDIAELQRAVVCLCGCMVELVALVREINMEYGPQLPQPQQRGMAAKLFEGIFGFLVRNKL